MVYIAPDRSNHTICVTLTEPITERIKMEKSGDAPPARKSKADQTPKSTSFLPILLRHYKYHPNFLYKLGLVHDLH